MPRSRPTLLIWLLGASALLFVGTGYVRAQETPKAETPPADEKPTPWPPKNTVKEDIKNLVLYVPKTWKRENPKNMLRLAQFTIPPAAGEKDPVELTIFSFAGGGAGGGVNANVNRWIDQFNANGRKQKIVTGEGHQGLYVLVDLQGTYNMPDGPPIAGKTKPLPNARMLAVIIGIRWEEEVGEGDAKKTEKKSAVYFLKMAGDEKTVTANKDAFRLAFGATNPSKENEIKEESAAPPAE